MPESLRAEAKDGDCVGASMAALGVDVQMQGRGPSWFPGQLISPVLWHFVLARKGTPWALPQGSLWLETWKAPQVSLTCLALRNLFQSST